VSRVTADPFPAVEEADATGALAALFDDIRTTLGVPVVNLIWRHLATIPGALDFAWTVVKPLYVNGDIIKCANDLRGNLNVPHTPQRALNDLTAAELSQISTIIQSYERSNAMNLIGFSALLAMLEGRSATDIPVAPQRDRTSVEGTLPTAIAVADMPDATRAIVQSLQSIGGADVVMPTMYRHLAHWPAMLEKVLAVLEPLEDAGEIVPAIQAAQAEGLRIGTALAARSGKTGVDLPPERRDALHRAVSHFLGGVIAKMVVIVAILRQAFPDIGK
jgi:hypothetical protein